ncbi:uncharacterized protein F5Z01DRAFT_473790 [Emericellopsis atlantica]|uniref:Uncharacterized protein n=1 Tax=Emericellopsis atlantica TaxID=2614577 RepID=A0A9P7ZCX0_9HYPO|nr:uncharacterized protein F5Z01DRAFT_473790 [Emericellopsis atlantica]KAG9249611.1 hypothetical protein F5Z01DRAFT_473790 [Emericellopsis atlantica]
MPPHANLASTWPNAVLWLFQNAAWVSKVRPDSGDAPLGDGSLRVVSTPTRSIRLRLPSQRSVSGQIYQELPALYETGCVCWCYPLYRASLGFGPLKHPKLKLMGQRRRRRVQQFPHHALEKPAANGWYRRQNTLNTTTDRERGWEREPIECGGMLSTLAVSLGHWSRSWSLPLQHREHSEWRCHISNLRLRRGPSALIRIKPAPHAHALSRQLGHFQSLLALKLLPRTMERFTVTPPSGPPRPAIQRSACRLPVCRVPLETTPVGEESLCHRTMHLMALIDISHERCDYEPALAASRYTWDRHGLSARRESSSKTSSATP